jgi:hypothetical protein
MKIALHAPLAAMLLLFSPQLAAAQDASPCKADREKFCPGIERGDGKLRECMQRHEAELSPACKERQEAWKKLRVACKADEDKFCAGAGSERGARMKCLEGHAGELGQECADALKSRPAGKNS